MNLPVQEISGDSNMNDKYLDTRMLLKIVLQPDIYLGGQTRAIADNQRIVYVDLVQLVQDNIAETVLNPAYVSRDDVISAMNNIDGNGIYTNGIKRVYLHMCKLLFMVNLQLIRYKYTFPDNLVRVMPTIHSLVYNRLSSSNDLEYNGKHIKSWYMIDNLNDFDKKFYDFKTDKNSWIYTALGSVFQEYPLCINLLNTRQVLNTITNLSTDEYLNALAQCVYLSHYGFLIAFTRKSESREMLGEVNLLENS